MSDIKNDVDSARQKPTLDTFGFCPASLKTETEDASIVYLIGDSISVNYGTYLERLLPQRFRLMRRSGDKEALENLDIPQGSNSGDSAAVLEFVRDRFSAGACFPKLLLWNCGLHDIKRDRKTGALQVPLDAYRCNLTAMVEILNASGIRSAWVRITPVDDVIHNQRHHLEFHRFASDCDAYNATADQVMQDHEVPVIDLYGFTRQLGSGDVLYCDHVHFHEEISRLQAAFLAGWITAYGRII